MQSARAADEQAGNVSTYWTARVAPEAVVHANPTRLISRPAFEVAHRHAPEQSVHNVSVLQPEPIGQRSDDIGLADIAVSLAFGVNGAPEPTGVVDGADHGGSSHQQSVALAHIRLSPIIVPPRFEHDVPTVALDDELLVNGCLVIPLLVR